MLITDIPLYGISGLSVAEKVSCNVLIYTERFEARYILAALRCGVKGYISRTNADIADAIRNTADGVSVYDKKVLQIMDSGCSQKPLTPNEKQLLRWVVKGYKEEQIAQILGCNIDKAHNLYRCLKTRLKCGTQAQAVYYALKNGYMDFNDFR